MKTKSLVQERLESAKNRLEVITREVESQRMPPSDVSKGLRQIGTQLETAQKLILNDSNVKFQQPLNQKLEIGMNKLSTTIRQLDGNGITNNNLNANLIQVGKLFDSIQEFLDLEIEDIR